MAHEEVSRLLFYKREKEATERMLAHALTRARGQVGGISLEVLADILVAHIGPHAQYLAKAILQRL